MRLSLLSISLLIRVIAAAQPTVTRLNFPVSGTVVRNYSAESTQLVRAEAGADVVWDLSNLEPEFVSEKLFFDPASSNFGDDFHDSNIAFEINGDYTYMTITNDVVKLTGFGVNSCGEPYKIKYNNDWLQYSLPLRWNDRNADEFSVSCAVDFDGHPGNDFLTAEFSYVVDGYGTLITPHRTYENVLRVFTITHGRDSSVANDNPDNPIVNVYTAINVIWISADEYYAGEIASTPDFRTFYFYESDNSTTKLSQVDSKVVRIYPVPATEFIFVESLTPLSGEASVSIFDAMGNLVKNFRINEPENISKWQLPVDDLSPGFYYLRVEDKSCSCKSAFIKE